MTKRIWLIAFAMVIIVSNGIAQVTNLEQGTVVKKNIDLLKGLKKAEPGDIDAGKPLMLDPSATPIYSDNLSLIEGDEFMRIMMSGDYIPEPYIDNNKEVKAFVLRKATEQEKAQMKEMQGDMQSEKQNKNDLIGKEAFSFSVTDILGNTYSLEKLKGKVIVINFWFVECKPCVIEIPELNNLVDKYKGEEVVFLGFATNDKSKIEGFLKTKTYKYNIIADGSNVARMYKVNAYPTHLIIDKNSKIAYCSTGLGPTTVTDLEKTIELLIK
jgi:peroxiredoxin